MTVCVLRRGWLTRPLSLFAPNSPFLLFAGAQRGEVDAGGRFCCLGRGFGHQCIIPTTIRFHLRLSYILKAKLLSGGPHSAQQECGEAAIVPPCPLFLAP